MSFKSLFKDIKKKKNIKKNINVKHLKKPRNIGRLLVKDEKTDKKDEKKALE